MKRYLVTIFGKDFDAMSNLVNKYNIDIIRQTARMLDDKSGYQVDAIVNTEQVKILKANSYHIKILENIEETAKARKKEIGERWGSDLVFLQIDTRHSKRCV